MPANVSKEVILADTLRKLTEQNDISTMLSILGYICGQQADGLAPTDAAKAKIWLRLAIGLDKLNAMVEEAKL